MKMWVNFMAILSILRPFGTTLFGIFYSYWVHFTPLWYVVARKIWQPWL
jgi:hypothetical protein